MVIVIDQRHEKEHEEDYLVDASAMFVVREIFFREFPVRKLIATAAIVIPPGITPGLISNHRSGSQP